MAGPEDYYTERERARMRRTTERSTAGFTRPDKNSPYYQQSQYGSAPVLEYTDEDGFVQKWNPRSKIYEVIRTVAPPVYPTQEQPAPDFSLGSTGWGGQSRSINDKRLRDIARIGTQSLQSKIGFQDLLRGIRRAETGAKTQLRGIAAETSGYARGPATEAAGPGAISRAAGVETSRAYGAQAQAQAQFAEQQRQVNAAAEAALFDLARRIASEADSRVRSVLQGEMTKIINAMNLGGQ
jgi:hypothetical protein